MQYYKCTNSIRLHRFALRRIVHVLRCIMLHSDIRAVSPFVFGLNSIWFYRGRYSTSNYIYSIPHHAYVQCFSCPRPMWYKVLWYPISCCAPHCQAVNGIFEGFLSLAWTSPTGKVLKG